MTEEISPAIGSSAVTPAAKPMPPYAAYLPLSILRAAWKQKGTFAVCAILSALAGGIGFRLLPRSYRAETLILVEAQQIPERLVDSTVQVDLADRLSAIQQQMLSSARLQKVIEKNGLAPPGTAVKDDELEELRKDISMKLERGWSRTHPGAIRVTYSGPDPRTAAAVANDLGNLFVAENIRSRGQHADGTSEFLADQLKRSRAQLELVEGRLAAYKRTNSGELPEQAQALIGSIGRLQMDLQSRHDRIARARQDRTMAEATLRGAESALSDLRKPVPVEVQAPVSRPPDAAQRSAQVPAPRKQSEILEEQLASATQRYSDKHPSVKALRADLELARIRESRQAATRLSDAAATRPASGTPADAPQPQGRTDSRDAEISRLNERISAAKSQLEMLAREEEEAQRERDRISGELGEAQTRLARMPIHEQQLLTLMRDYESASNQYKSLTEKSFNAGMAAEMERRHQAERFRILEPARIPERPFRPDRRKGAIAIALGALVSGALAAFLRELRRDTVLGEWELPDDVEILARVPNIS